MKLFDIFSTSINFPGLEMVMSFLFTKKRREHWVIFWNKFIDIQLRYKAFEKEEILGGSRKCVDY